MRKTRPQRSKSPSASLFALLLATLTIACIIKGQRLHRHPARHLNITRPVTITSGTTTSDSLLESDMVTYLSRAKSLPEHDYCTPVAIRTAQAMLVSYHHCPNAALAKDGEGVTLSEDFQVSAALARRFNFWRRVYSVWSKDTYVIHVSPYPEVVLATLGTENLDLGDVGKERAVTRLAKTEEEHFRRLLLTMHHNRQAPERFSPAMQRVARIMAHIPDEDKYLTAYHSLRLQRGQRDFIRAGLETAPKYLPAIEAEFAKQGVPREVSRLAFVESSFNLQARSRVGASGVYQIMPETGRQFLMIRDGVDERNDPIKASRAAAKVLKSYYAMTGSWPLAITAYNHGVGGIRRAMAAVGSAELPDLINEYRGNNFGFASKNFYTSFLGVLATLKYSDQIFPGVTPPAPLNFTPVRLQQATAVSTLLGRYQLSVGTLASLNPDLSTTTLRRSAAASLPAGYVVKIPQRSAARPPWTQASAQARR